MLYIDLVIIFPFFAFQIVPLNIILMVFSMSGTLQKIKESQEERKRQNKNDFLEKVLLLLDKLYQYEKSV